MNELIRVMVEPLLHEPEKLTLSESREDGDLTITIHVAEADMGRIIGKGGRVINAIRTVVKAAATKQGLRVFVEVV